MLLPEDKGGWIDAAVDVAKNLGHGIETTFRQAGRQIAVHSDDLPDIESISDLEDIRQNPEEYAERFNRGGLTVAATQFAIGLAAAVGGFTYDNLGINGIFLAAAGISVMAALLIAVSFSLFARDTGHKA